MIKEAIRGLSKELIEYLHKNDLKIVINETDRKIEIFVENKK